MKPPIFPPFNAPLPALEWHARARQFREQAIGMSDIVNGQPNWPRYFLLAHAAELAIRTVLVHAKTVTGKTVGQSTGQHDLSGLYAQACHNGLKSNQQVLAKLQYLSDIHENHVARYPKGPGQVWVASEFDDAIDGLMSDTWNHIKPV